MPEQAEHPSIHGSAGVLRGEGGLTEKGLGLLKGALEQTDIAALNWNLLREDLSLPTAVLYKEKLEHNLSWMQQFASSYGVKLAPHGKTTMAPRLFQMQLEAGAWGITLATAQQVQVAYDHGVRRVLMANQLVGRQNMAAISRLLQDPDFEFYCLVDSAELVNMLGAFYATRGQQLHVLLEMGIAGGRTGVRDATQLTEVIGALNRWGDTLALSGIEIYEGLLDEATAIGEFLDRAIAAMTTLMREKQFRRAPILLSGAGSAWYDVVAEEFTRAKFGDAVEIVLRPGCYVTHDAGVYATAQRQVMARNTVAVKMQSGLVPALQIWAYVQSIPEKGRAIIGMGKRDASFDSGLPVPELYFRPGAEAPKPAANYWAVTRMMDQHAFLQMAPGDDLRVGDMVGFGISHPCLTFDKWRTLPILDSQYRVLDVIRTFF